ncbi:MAG: hypothetical protein P8Y74_17970 [Desulfobacterales bacterium]
MMSSIKPQSLQWETICRRCGRCCYEKIDFEGHIYFTEIPCEYLDLNTHLCQVYMDRDNKRPGCVRLTIDHLDRGLLPPDCAYLAGLEKFGAMESPGRGQGDS